MSDGSIIEFKYDPLDASKKDIRVLHILPGVDADPLKCSLIHIPLNDSADYDALSYAWQDPTLYSDQHERSPLLVNGRLLEIGNNLAAFLRSWREKQDDSHQIWIDAVCINQQDYGERNAQVPRMREIYQRANLVIIWLGPALNRGDVAVNFLKLVFRKSFPDDEVAWFRNLIQDDNFEMDWKALVGLLERAWWDRIWIVQEVVLAKQAFILCGTMELTWKELEYALHYTSILLEDCRAYIEDSDDHARISKRVRKINRLTSLRRRRDELTAVDVFESVGGNNCKDMKDKIYGLMGIIADSVVFPAVDYSPEVAVEEVHLRSFGSLAVQTHNLDFLSLVLNRPRKTLGGGFPATFPSWCPDMTSKYFTSVHRLNTIFTLPLQSTPQFCASGTEPAIAELSPNAKTLYLSGICIDTIDGVFPGDSGFSFTLKLTGQARSSRTMYGSEDQTYEALWRSFVAGINRYSAIEGNYEAPPHFGEIFARQCCNVERQHQSLITEGIETPFDVNNPSSKTPNHVFIPEDSIWQFNTWYKYNRSALFAGRSIKSWAEKYNPDQDQISVEGSSIQPRQTLFSSSFSGSWGPANLGRRMVTTEKGYVGMVLELCKRGDLVCLLFGCRMPVVLRPESAGFRFMGECYVQSLMFGEGIEARERGECKVEKFELM